MEQIFDILSGIGTDTALPLIIFFGVSLYRKRSSKAPKSTQRPLTTYDKISNYLLITMAIYFAYSALTNTSIYYQLNIAGNASSYQFRVACDKFASSNNARLNGLCVNLQSDKNRFVYKKYGNVFDCVVCNSEEDYYMFSLKSVMVEYLRILVLCGVVSMTPRRNSYRLSSSIIVFTLLLGELSIRNSDSAYYYVTFVEFHILSILRNGIFILLTIWLYFADSLLTESEIVSNLIEQTLVTRTTSHLNELIRVSTFNDISLQTRFVAYSTQSLQAIRKFHQKSEVKAVVRNLKLKFNMEQLRAEARLLVDPLYDLFAVNPSSQESIHPWDWNE